MQNLAKLELGISEEAEISGEHSAECDQAFGSPLSIRTVEEESDQNLDEEKAK